jgi:mersacidin/lichenicidin family type 2 lantibiotic
MPTNEPTSSHALAEIYVARALDSIVDLAGAVARDFVKRPQQYTRASSDETTLLTNFRLLVGKHPEWPDAAQRSFASKKPLARTSQPFTAVRLAAIQFVRNASAPGSSTAQRSFIDAATFARATVQPLEGAALSAVANMHSALLRRAVGAVSCVSAAFGVAVPTEGAWPQGMYSPQFDYLCENISQTLHLDPPLRQTTMSSLQRAAHYGAATVNGVLNPSLADAGDEVLSDVIHAATSWAAALAELLSRIDIARAWKDPAYRARLHALEKDIVPPHPSGEITLEGTIRTQSARLPSISVGFSTETVAGEICCSTGDLVCGADTDICNTNGDCGLSDECPTLTEILT